MNPYYALIGLSAAFLLVLLPMIFDSKREAGFSGARKLDPLWKEKQE